MGKKRNQSKENDPSDATEDTIGTLSGSIPTGHMSIKDFENHMETLHGKRASMRERALGTLVDAFERCALDIFLPKMYITLAYRFLNSIKIGSVTEACLASRAIGLLSIAIGRESAHEILKASMSQFSEVLKFGPDVLKKSVADCLTIITLIGARNDDEVQESMKMLWVTCNPKPSAHAGLVTDSVLVTAISAWSLLLAILDGWTIGTRSCSSWKESISFLSRLMEKDDPSVRAAACEAISRIFKIGRLDKFYREDDDLDIDSVKGKLSVHCIEENQVFSSLERNFLRRYLGKSLNNMLKENNLIRDIFGVSRKEEFIYHGKITTKTPCILTKKDKTQIRNRDRAQARRYGFTYTTDLEQFC